MYHHRLKISYKGSDYYGWQDLGSREEKPTIEESIKKVLHKICKEQTCSISTASRTDAGVHAQGQVIKITIPLHIESKKLQLGMNSLLADDIRVLECEPCLSEFNPNKDAKNKEYHYYFCTDSILNPVLNDVAIHISSNIDIKRMQEACKLFIGKHDFYSFAKRDTSMMVSVRSIISCEIIQAQPLAFANEVYYLKIVGEGFLRYMVRYIASTLFEVGKEKLTLSDISEALSEHKEDKLSAKAPSRGLHLIAVNY